VGGRRGDPGSSGGLMPIGVSLLRCAQWPNVPVKGGPLDGGGQGGSKRKNIKKETERERTQRSRSLHGGGLPVGSRRWKDLKSAIKGTM